MSSGEEEFHSSEEKEDVWIHHKDIGIGGFGVVKLFVNETTGKKVVLKECRQMNLSPEFMERWYGELKIIKRLNHKNIVRAMDVPSGLSYKPMGNVPFICMEYCDRGDLRQVLRAPENCCGLTEEQIRQICGDVNAGIRFLHSQKVIHRDLKPENILIKNTISNQVVYKLTDFGYSKSYDQNSVCTSLVGTMQYVAPEVIKSRRYHSSVDFWSFGVVVFECITGRRPFLHGSPSNNIAWIDYVAKKQPEDIHIYFKKDGSSPVTSSSLPHPHRLSKTFESLITSWLQTALHYTPEMRGGRRRVSEDAPCLSNMDHILATKVMGAVCMSTGEEVFINVEENTTYGMLQQQVHCSSSVSPAYQFQILPSGRMPQAEDLVAPDMQGNIGRVYIFNNTLDPSFKLMHTTSEAVSAITAYGDAKISPVELREVYAQVYFHIREYYSFFQRLQHGHSAILYQLTKLRDDVQSRQASLADQLLITREVVSLVAKMYQDDYYKLSSCLESDKLPMSQTANKFQSSWKESATSLQQREKEVQSMSMELAKIREETNSYLCMADDLQTNYEASYNRLDEYNQNYVVAACDLYKDIKISRGLIPERSMQDILLRAIDEAQAIIVESFNGYNFGQTYLTLRTHLQKIIDKTDWLYQMKREAIQLKDKLRGDLWEFILEASDPMRSLHGPLYRASSGISMHIEGTENNSQLQMTDDSRTRTAEGLRKQFSQQSVGSVDSVNDFKLAESIINLKRHVSEEENSRVIARNKELIRKLSSSLSSGNGHSEFSS